jgi:hypothetical protein
MSLGKEKWRWAKLFQNKKNNMNFQLSMSAKESPGASARNIMVVRDYDNLAFYPSRFFA